MYVLNVSSGPGYTSAKLEFHAYTPDIGPMTVSIEPQGFHSGHLQPSVLCNNARTPVGWHFDHLTQDSIGYAKMYKRADGDRLAPSGYTLQYLFESREALMRQLKPEAKESRE